MLKQNIIDNLNLYHSNHVRVTEVEGGFFDGELVSIEGDRLLLKSSIEEREYDCTQLADIEYIGLVTDYHTYKGIGEIDKIYEFDVISDELLEKIEYLEFTCKVACHLELNKKIIAKDVKLVEAVHVLNKEVLQEEDYLYKLKDGRRLVGRLTEENDSYCLKYKDCESYDINPVNITDITRCPAVNDYVLVSDTADATYKGLVSAVTAKGFNILVDKKLVVILFANLEELRYFGRMSMRGIGKSNKQYGMIDQKYGCKMPHYLHNEDDEKYTTDPDSEWIYVAGVNDRGLIAKDVMHNEGEQVTEAVAWEVGVLGAYNEKDSKGFITDKFVSDAARQKVKFWFQNENRNLSEELIKKLQDKENSKSNIYLVKYAYANEGDKNPSRIELIRTYNKNYIGRVEVNEGSVRAIPYFYLARERYQKQAVVEVQLTNDTILKGAWEKYGQRMTEEDHEFIRVDERYDDTYGILLKCGDKKEFIACNRIKDIRTVGTITGYDAKNQIAKVDKMYTLFKLDFPKEIKELLAEDPSGATILNMKVSFVIRNIPEERQRFNNEVPLWTECKQAEIVKLETVDFYVTDYDPSTNICSIIDQNEYETSGNEIKEITANLQDVYKKFEFDKYDYLLRFTVEEERNGERKYELADKTMTALVFKGKELEGYLTGLSEMKGKYKVSIVSVEQYGKCNVQSEYPLATLDEKMQTLLSNIENEDYSVRYRWSNEGIILLEVSKPQIKRYFGYLSSDNGKQEGERSWVITLENAARRDGKANNKANQVLCWHSNLVCGNEEICGELSKKQVTINKHKGAKKCTVIDLASIDRNRYNYYVTFTLNQKKLQEGKRCAERAEIIRLEKRIIIRETEERKELIDLEEMAEKLGLIRAEGVEYTYGVISSFSTENAYFMIRDYYQKKNGGPFKLYAKVINAEVTLRYVGETESLNTAERYYIVRYVPRAIEDRAGQDSIGIRCEYPIDIMCSYDKKNIDALRINLENNELTVSIKKETLYAEDGDGILAIPKNICKEIPAYVENETLLYKNSNGQYKVSCFKELKDNKIYLQNNERLDPKKTIVYRFGVLTGIGGSKSKEDGRRIVEWGYLNHALQFPYERMQESLRNSFYQDYKRRLVVYTQKDGCVTEVLNVTDEMVKRLPWKLAEAEAVADVEKESETIFTVIDKENHHTIKYYLTANNNPVLKARKEQLVHAHSEVGIKEIKCPDWTDGQYDKLVTLAAGIVVEKEQVDALNNKDYLRIIKESTNFNLDEYTYYLLNLLQKGDVWEEERVGYVFAPIFYERGKIKDVLQKELSLKEIFSNECKADNIPMLVSHMVALDDTSYEHIKSEIISEEYSGILSKVTDYCKEYILQNADSESDVWSCLSECRKFYKDISKKLVKGFAEYAKSENHAGIVSGIRDILTNFYNAEYAECFERLLYESDRERLRELRACCDAVVEMTPQNVHTSGSEVRKQIKELYSEVEKTPTPFVTMNFPVEDIWAPLRNEINDIISSYYQEAVLAPDIRCRLNDATIMQDKRITINNKALVSEEQRILYVIVRNGEDDTKHYAKANGINVAWLIPELGMVDSKVVKIGTLDSGCYNYFSIKSSDVPGIKTWNVGDEFSLKWTASYSYEDEDGKREQRNISSDKESWNTEVFQIVENVDKGNIQNPYQQAAEGGVLKDEEMFYGRISEQTDIWCKLTGEDRRIVEEIIRSGQKIDNSKLQPKKNIVVYGLKTCGKSSLVAHMEKQLEKEPASKPIILKYDLMELGDVKDYQQRFAAGLITRFRDVVKESFKNSLWPEVEKWSIPDLVGKSTWFDDFNKYFNPILNPVEGQEPYRIIVRMDEFTGLCVSLYEGWQAAEKQEVRNQYKEALNIFRKLSDMGFILIYIGHAAMMSALKQMDALNLITKDALKLLMCEFKDDKEAKALIYEPMTKACGYNPYETVLGAEAVQRLIELSGGCPSILMKLCNQMMRRYISKNGRQLTVIDVNNMAKLYVNAVEKTEFFDLMLEESGDSEPIKKDIAAYLDYVAIHTDKSTGFARIDDEQCREETGINNPEDIRRLLKERKVLEVLEKAQIVKIKIGLYVTCIQKD